MRTRLDAMGPVNMMALEEYKETAERHAFLETQRKDLYDSIENTQATIKEIDTFSRQKFEEAFHKINENFQATFRKLFGGGQGFMRLTDEENSAESGIDVVASPPGKKLQNVLLLSGGEKAMTALALLVGIFQYQPSPFCILDEVDAPLDEANIGRFTELVKEMSLQTQFVLITHSKKTMSIAPGALRRDHAGAGSFQAGVSQVRSDGVDVAARRPRRLSCGRPVIASQLRGRKTPRSTAGEDAGATTSRRYETHLASRVSMVFPSSTKACIQPSTRIQPSPWPFACSTLPANPSWRIFTNVPVPAFLGPAWCRLWTPRASNSQRTTVFVAGE